MSDTPPIPPITPIPNGKSYVGTATYLRLGGLDVLVMAADAETLVKVLAKVDIAKIDPARFRQSILCGLPDAEAKPGSDASVQRMPQEAPETGRGRS